MERNEFNDKLVERIAKPMIKVLKDSKNLLPTELTNEEQTILQELRTTVLDYTNAVDTR